MHLMKLVLFWSVYTRYGITCYEPTILGPMSHQCLSSQQEKGIG